MFTLLLLLNQLTTLSWDSKVKKTTSKREEEGKEGATRVTEVASKEGVVALKEEAEGRRLWTKLKTTSQLYESCEVKSTLRE